MKYTKQLLVREERDFEDELFYGTVFEIVNNEKTLEEFISKALTKLSGIKGKIHVVQRSGDQIHVLTDEDNENREMISKSEVYKKLRETKKPFFYNGWEEGQGEFYVGFPLNLKGKMVGLLLIEEKQDIKCWKEIFLVLHMLVFAYRHYSLVEKERDMNIKDVITGLYNEKYFYNHFEVEEEKYRRFKTPMTLVLFKVKNIAEINDLYGYETGEKVLQIVGKTILNQCRLIDMPARVERGLFGVLLSSTEEKGGSALSNRVHKFLENEIQINDIEIKIDFKSAFSTFQNHHSRESFFAEIYNKMDV